MEGNVVKESVMPMNSMPPHSEIPILSPFSSSSSSFSKGNNNNSRKRERERCLKMTHMYNQLQATVPGLFPKASREMIVNKTIEYIKELEEKKQKLEEMKESIKSLQGNSFTTTTNTNCSLTLSVSTNNVAFFSIQSLPQPASVTLIFNVFFKHQAQILAANVSVNQGILILAITALVQNGTVEIIKREIMSF